MNKLLIRPLRLLPFLGFVLCLLLSACESEQDRLAANKENVAVLSRYGAEFSTLPGAVPEGWLLVGIDTGQVDTSGQNTSMPTNSLMLEFAPLHEKPGGCFNHVQFRFYPASYEAGIRDIIKKYLRLREGRPHPPKPESWRNAQYFVNVFPCFCGQNEPNDACQAVVEAVTAHFGLERAPDPNL